MQSRAISGFSWEKVDQEMTIEPLESCRPWQAALMPGSDVWDSGPWMAMEAAHVDTLNHDLS
jgi:hypothetical protein